MPLLSYTSSDFPFQPFTKIFSADINQCFNDVKTLLNVTGLDDTNLAANGITRGTKLKTGTANYVVINDGTGAMSEEAALAAARGGTGASLNPAGGQTDDVIKVSAGVLILGSTPTPAPVKIFNFYKFF